MKKLLLSLLCCILLCLQLVPCFAAINNIQIEKNEDGSYFIIGDEPILSNPLPPDENDTAGPPTVPPPGDSSIQESGNQNSLIQVLKKIINAILRLLGRINNQSEVTKSKYIYYYSSDSKLVWSGELTGEFLYSGSSVQCIDASFSFTSYDSNWKLDDYNCKEQNATASVTFSVVQKSLGVKLQTITKTLTLTCDTNGKVT